MNLHRKKREMKEEMGKTIDLKFFSDRDPAAQVEHLSYKDLIINPSENYPPPEYQLCIGGTDAFPRGDIQAIKGKAKAGKTTAMSLITAGMLADDFNERLAMFSRPKGRSRVLHVDTEKHPRSVAWKQKIVYQLIGADTNEPLPDYAVLSLRELSFSDRCAVTKEAIKDFGPGFVLIDGIVDMIADFNDSAESKGFISGLMTEASKQNCAICCVLHENKGKGDNTMRGHLGSELLNKCSETYQVSQVSGIFTVTQTESRNSPAPDFWFSIDSEGMPVMADESLRTDPREKRLIEAMAVFNMVLGYCDARPYVRDLKDKGVIIQDEWIDAGDGVRFKRHWIANEPLHSNIPGIRAVGEVMQTNFKNLFEKRRQDD